jgi:hypothetical protein
MGFRRYGCQRSPGLAVCAPMGRFTLRFPGLRNAHQCRGSKHRPSFRPASRADHTTPAFNHRPSRAHDSRSSDAVLVCSALWPFRAWSASFLLDVSATDPLIYAAGVLIMLLMVPSFGACRRPDRSLCDLETWLNTAFGRRHEPQALQLILTTKRSLRFALTDLRSTAEVGLFRTSAVHFPHTPSISL